MPRLETVHYAKLGAPGSLAAVVSSTVTNRIDVSWAAVTNADEYRLQWKSGSEDYDAARESLVSGTTYDAVFEAETTYTFRVRAERSDGLAETSDWSMEASVTTPEAIVRLAAPTGVTATPSMMVNGGIVLTWNAVPLAESYEYRWRTRTTPGTGSYGAWSSWTAGASGLVFTDTVGQQYEFVVRARLTGSPAGPASAAATATAPQILAMTLTLRVGSIGIEGNTTASFRRVDRSTDYRYRHRPTPGSGAYGAWSAWMNTAQFHGFTILRGPDAPAGYEFEVQARCRREGDNVLAVSPTRTAVMRA